jgi:RNA polymerase sigma factor (sigma-70 family)
VSGGRIDSATAGGLVRTLRVLARGRDAATDGELVRQFVARRDEAAFAALVRRHGPMVLGVCRRTLGDRHDAEDAFQATFLVLARKAAAVRPPGRVGNWLYGVACRTARKARAAAVARRARARAGARPEAVPPDGRAEWREVLDRELGRLPDRYRAPIVLCDLEGRSYQEAARQLGWPAGTLSGRLSRGRALLARRLLRRGLGPAAGAAALAAASAPAGAWPPLTTVTVRAAVGFVAGEVTAGSAAALATGVLRAMSMQALKTAAGAALLTGLLFTGAGAALRPTQAADQAMAAVVVRAEPAAAAEEPPKPAPAADKPALPPVPVEETVYHVPERRFEMPVRVSPEYCQKLKAILVYISADRGRTWQLAACLTPGETAFTYVAPADGLYWFGVCSVLKDGLAVPPDLWGLTPQLKVRVGAGGEPAPDRKREIEAIREQMRALEKRLRVLEKDPA